MAYEPDGGSIGLLVAKVVWNPLDRLFNDQVFLPRQAVMIRRLCVLCFLLALWPGLASADSAALTKSYNQYKALDAQDRYAEAEPFAAEALELSSKEFGPDHPKTGIMLNNLAQLYQNQGRHAEAEPLYRRSLAIDEKAFGPEYPTVATYLDSLAAVYRAQGRYAEAEPLHKRSLAIREKTLAPECLIYKREPAS